MAGEFSIGCLVSSRAGRDRGRFFIVIGPASESFVTVVDGQKRSVERPKRKNIRHLVAHGNAPGSLYVKLARGDKVSDAEIREALSRFNTVSDTGVDPASAPEILEKKGEEGDGG
ncbi:MAG: KOW domain-containing RNA-binding protein, partial [Armatimonadetes bacterium]|nr:KOW domain-containing RNA-binding protein [Armatimonadota bacterium]